MLPYSLETSAVKIAKILLNRTGVWLSNLLFVGIKIIEKAVRPVEKRLESGGVEQIRPGRCKFWFGKARASRPINDSLRSVEIIPMWVEAHHCPT